MTLLLNWQTQTGHNLYNLQNVIYGGGLFVAFGQGDNGFFIATSPDGYAWTPRNVEADGNYFSLVSSMVYGNGLYLLGGKIFGGSTALLKTSPDCITWTTRTVPFTGASSKVTAAAYGNGVYVISGREAGQPASAYSSDGITWNLGTNQFGGGGSGGYINDIIWDSVGSRFVAVGEKRGTLDWEVETSTNGQAFTNIYNDHDDISTNPKIAFNGTVFIATGQKNDGTGSIKRSTNLTSWTQQTNLFAPAGAVCAVTYSSARSLWIVGGNRNASPLAGEIETSDDGGLTWTRNTTHGFVDDTLGFATNNQVVVAVGDVEEDGEIETATLFPVTLTFAEFKNTNYVDWANE